MSNVFDAWEVQPWVETPRQWRRDAESSGMVIREDATVEALTRTVGKGRE